MCRSEGIRPCMGDGPTQNVVASLIDAETFDGNEVEVVFHYAERAGIAHFVFANGTGTVGSVGKRKADRTFADIRLDAAYSVGEVANVRRIGLQ